MTFPKEELFGLSAQMRRAAISIPANIAEGLSKRGRPDKGRYLNTAQASIRGTALLLHTCSRSLISDGSVLE